MKQYLGDGVYVDVERGMLKLTTENGICATNTIYLEPEVLHALMQYMRQFEIIDSTQEGDTTEAQ